MNAYLLSVLFSGTFVFATALPVEYDSVDPVIGVFEASSVNLEVNADEDCDWQCYLNRYPDLRAAFGTNTGAAAAHYQSHGRREGRNCKCSVTGAPNNNRCCHFPTRPLMSGGQLHLGGGIKRNPATGGFKFEHDGDVFAASICSGRIVMQCADGRAIKEASTACGMLPIEDSSTWNAMGFDLPSVELGFFGLTFDVTGLLYGNTDSGGGMCFAYQNGATSNCGGGFAFAQDGILKATCYFAGPVLVCVPSVVELPVPTLELQLLSGGFSPARELHQQALIGFWNGRADLATSLDAEFSSRGVFALQGNIKFSAFNFLDMEVSMVIEGRMLIDVRAQGDPAPELRKIINSLVSGDLKGMVNNDAGQLPAFQVTLSGAVVYEISLGPGFEFEVDSSSVGLTFGYGMDAETNGFSNGLYGATRREQCLHKMIPPLGNHFFTCNGRPIFRICVNSYSAFYLSANHGFAFESRFEANIAQAIQAAVTLKINMHKAELGATLQVDVSGTKFNVGVAVGFTYSRSSWPRPYLRVTPDVGNALRALGTMAGQVARDLTREVLSFFGLEEEEILEFEVQQAERASRELSNKQVMHAKQNMAKRRLLAEGEGQATVEATLGNNKTLLPNVISVKDLETSTGSKWGHWHHRHHRHHWHHRHHRHHWHHRHRPHFHHRHWPHVHAADILRSMLGIEDLSVSFSDVRASLTICGNFVLRFKLTVSAKLGGRTHQKTFEVDVAQLMGDLVQLIKSQVNRMFNIVKSSFCNSFGLEHAQQVQALIQKQLREGRRARGGSHGQNV